ncbi:MAG: hypothetical protein P0Y49_20145 [Candidatus Pedobacter colombiensis]|uniref:Glycerophosphoryl diester phosphodiesterase membrane domain-containing protein n=1 Tax=Candidatus Pedobacter colombiensis TaxID=3121371 RepID=A0AAJ5W8E0_9SPHI|nr:hypothetical protein [Pedobacter sp.]WEK19091.1 MAG: hypothetical protein P0Y49_20145 [Pedobacter sp.]
MSEKLELKKLRAFGEIINDTFLFIKENFRPLLKVFVYLCGFFILAGMIAAIMQQLETKAFVNGISKMGASAWRTNLSQIFTFNYLLVVIFSICSSAAILVSTLSFIALYIQKGNVAPTPDEVWSYFKYYYFRVFFSNIFTLLIVIVGFMFCLVPGIYLFPAMSLLFPIMVLENANFQYSFERSFKLLKNQWWVTAGSIFILWVIAYACMTFASVPAAVLTMAGTFLPGLEGWSQAMIVVGTIIQYLSYVFLMIPVIGVSLCFFNLVEIQESTGLMDRINHFGEEKDNSQGLEEY